MQNMAGLEEIQIVGGTDKMVDCRYALLRGVFKSMGGWGVIQVKMGT